MVKKKITKEQLVEDNEAEETKSSVILLSSDDDEANEDLSLQIVEKARLREAKRKRDAEEGVSAVIDLSSSSCEEVKVLLNQSGVEDVKKTKKKRRKKRSKEDNKSVGVMDTETITSVGTEQAGEVQREELGDIVKVVETTKPVETEVVENVVLRKLLRGPRYFDPPGTSCRTCFNCGEEGHNAVNCTSKRRKKPCFICGSFEHGVRNCTQGQDCFICKKQGHRAKDCPEKHQASSHDTKICLRCGEIGHLMFSCSKDYDTEDLKEIQCYVCKMPGHLCCVDSIEPGLVEVSCYNCGLSGHTGAGCAKQRGEAYVAVSASPTLCYKCGEEGHFARGCTNYSKPDRWMGEPSTPIRKYSKKGKASSGYRSAPPDLNKILNKRNKHHEARDFKTERKSKGRGGWIADDPEDFVSEGKSKRRGGWTADDPGDLGKSKRSGGLTADDPGNFVREGKSKRRGGWTADDQSDFPKRKVKDNGWRSPANPTNKVYKNPAQTNSPSSSRSPWRSSNSNPRTSSSHGSAAYPPPWRQSDSNSRTPSSYSSGYPPPYPVTPSYGSGYPPYPITPTSHGYANPHHHMHPAPGFGNSIGSRERRNYW